MAGGSLGETKNVGQIAALWISATAPTNVKLIWYDTAQSIHRVYESSTGNWIPLNPQIITNTNLAALAVVASGDGLAVGKFYFLTDLGVIAIAITTTKIWYVDSHSNYVVNDLAASIQYYLNSTNLFIDGSTGVWDADTGRLEFNFTEITAPSNTNDYVVMRRKSGVVWSWVKVQLNKLISAVAGNSISWNNGIYFNFSQAIGNIKNVSGGVVGYDAYVTAMQTINQNIENVALNNQSFIQQAMDYTDAAVTDEEIYDKQLPTYITPSVTVVTTPTVGWSFKRIFADIYGWFSKLKYATYIGMGAPFEPTGITGNVTGSDSVSTAIQKLVYKCFHPKLTAQWSPVAYTGTVNDVAAGDTVDDAFAKVVGRLNQLGIITNGNLASRNGPSVGTNYTDFVINDANGGSLQFNMHASNRNAKVSADKIALRNSGVSNAFENELTGFESVAEFSAHDSGVGSGKVGASLIGFKASTSLGVAMNENMFGFFTNSALLGNINFFIYSLTLVSKQTRSLSFDTSSWIEVGGVDGTILLPACEQNFAKVFFLAIKTASIVTVQAQANNKIDALGSSVQSVNLSGRGKVYMFVFRPGWYYAGDSGIDGTWFYGLLNYNLSGGGGQPTVNDDPNNQEQSTAPVNNDNESGTGNDNGGSGTVSGEENKETNGNENNEQNQGGGGSGDENQLGDQTEDAGGN